MELRHQHKTERDVSTDSDRKKDEPEVRPQWPGKKTLTGAQPVDARTPDLKRIRAAIGALRGGGGGIALPGSMTREYSQLLGLDLSDVRLHRGGAAADAAKSLDATAFTHGSHIAVADHLDLDSAFGRHVIAHELVHVAQNKRSGGGMDLAAHAEVGPSGSAVEQEAERGAAALTRGMSFVVGAHSRLPSISRFGNDENPPTGAASPVPVPGANPPPVDAPVRAQVPTPGSQPTQAQPAATPAPAPATPAATPAPQPRPGNQPAGATTAPAGTPGVNAPSGSGAAPNPTTPANREPRPAAAPRTTGSPTSAVSLDDRVKQELETRADPTLKAGYARAIAGVDSLRVQALQFSFQPNGVWNTLVETFTAKNAFQDHFGQIYTTNAYRGGTSWVDTAQSWIEGLRGVVHIIGDIASVVSAWAGLAALVTGALALILSETVIGGIALGAIAAIAAEVAMVAGAVKLLTDIIDTILGVIQMIILIVRARNSKDPAARARFAALLHKEANDFGANVVSIGVQVAVMAVSAGVGAGLSRGANTFVSSFRSEFTRMITPALKPWTLGSNIRGIANMMRPAAAGTGVRGLTGRNLAGQTVPRTVLNAEVNAGLIGVNRQLRVGNRITAARETIPFTAANQMRGARLVLMRRALVSNLLVNTGGFKIGFGASQLQADVKQPRASAGGTSSSSPSANGGTLSVPQAAGSDLSKVQMWPSQIEAFEAAKGPIQGTTDRTQRQYEMAEAQAGPELSAQVRTAFQGATNSAGQMRFGAMAVQTDAQEGQANTQRGLQQTQQAGQQRDQMGAQQNRASTSVNRINNEGAKLQSPPPKEGVLGWLYNQTIGRIGAWIGSAQKWVMNLVGKWAMSLAGFSKEEMDIAGIENDMREDDKKDQNSSQEAQDAALKADQIQQTVFQLQENKTRDEQYAIQGMADAQRFIQALEDADRQLAAAISNGQAYIGQVSPMIAHELQTEEAQASIDAAYIAPAVGGVTAFTSSIDGANVGESARQQGVGELNSMKAAFPELDLSTGTSAIGTAVQTYTTAFGTLAGSARTQAAAINTALQAFIGTQDYDGVSANSSALETLAADFQRQATALETQLFAAVQSVVDQYVTHIINAINQANAAPVDQPAPVDPSSTPTPASDEAPAVSPGSSGFGTGRAIQNTRASEAAAHSAAPVPTAEKPAAAEQPAPAAPTPTTEPTTPTAPAMDPKAKPAVDLRTGEAPPARPNAKPIATPKAQAIKSDADKTDEDKLELGDSQPTTSKPESSKSAEGGDRSPTTTQPAAESAMVEAIPRMAIPALNPIAASPTDVRKPARAKVSKVTTSGGGAAASAGTPSGELDVEAEGRGSGEGHVDADEGDASGEGAPGTAAPTEGADTVTAAADLTHTTEATASGAADDRTTVGVGEKVTFESTDAGAWTATSVGPGGVARRASSTTYEWIAPSTASSVTVTMSPARGAARSINMSVIAPSGIDFESPQPDSFPNGTQGAGMVTNIRYQPTTVSFYRTKWKEIGGPASGATGYFANRRLPAHQPNPNWLQIGDDNGGPTDHASFYGFPAPWSVGSFQWVVPNRYQVSGETGAGHEFAQITQSCLMEGDGTTTVTKGSATVTRSPGSTPARSVEGSAGYGTGSGNGKPASSASGETSSMARLSEVTSGRAEGFGIGGPPGSTKQRSYVQHKVQFTQVMTPEQFKQHAMKQIFGAALPNVKWENLKDSYDPKDSPITVNVELSLIQKNRGAVSKDKGIDVDPATGGIQGGDARAKEFLGAPASDEKSKVMAEIDRRYAEATGETTPIKPGEKGKAGLWNQIRDEVLFQHQYVKNLPPNVKLLIKQSITGRELTAADYDQLFRIGKSIEALPPGAAADYASKITGTTTSLDDFEAAVAQYSAKVAADQKAEDEHKNTMTKLAGLEGVFELYKDWKSKTATHPALGLLVYKDLEAALQRNNFAGVAEFESFQEKFLAGFEAAAAKQVVDYLDKYNGRLYREQERYKNPAEVSALHGKLSGYRSNMDVVKESEDIMQREYASQKQERDRSRLPGNGGTTPPPTPAFKAAEKKGLAARAQASADIGNLAAEHPIFADDQDLPVARRIDKIAMHSATETSLQGILLGFIKQRQDAVKDARGELGDTDVIYKMDKLFPSFKATQGIAPDSIHDKIIEHKRSQDRIKKIVVGILAAIAAIALTVISMGAATPAILAAAAGAGAFGLSAYMAYDEIKNYAQEKNLAEMQLVEDPSLFWVVLAVGGAALDASAAVKALRAIGPAAKALEAGGELVKFNTAVRALEKAGELDAKIARAAERAAAARRGVAEASADLSRVLGSKAYSFPGPLADPDVYKAVVKMAAAKFKELGNNGVAFIAGIQKEWALAKLGLTPEELVKVKQAWEEGKALAAAEKAAFENVSKLIPDVAKVEALVSKVGDAGKLERLLRIFSESELDAILVHLKDPKQLLPIFDHVQPQTAKQMLMEMVSKGKIDKLNQFVERMAAGGAQLGEAAAISSKSLIIDSQAAIALVKDSTGQALQDGEKLWVAYFKGLPGDVELRIGNVTVGEVKGGVISVKGLPLELAGNPAVRQTPEYQKVLTLLESQKVGKASGVADRAVIADALFAKAEAGVIPKIAIGDTNVVKPLARLAGIDVVKAGGYEGLVKAYGTVGFEVTVEGRKIMVVPLPKPVK